MFDESVAMPEITETDASTVEAAVIETADAPLLEVVEKTVASGTDPDDMINPIAEESGPAVNQEGFTTFGDIIPEGL